MSSERSEPGPGQESVWDYPRPPRVERFAGEIRVVLGGVTIAQTRRALRVLETSHPPVYYIPPQDVGEGHILPGRGTSYCEWKGRARYHDVVAGDVRAENGAWSYPDPAPAYRGLKDYLAFYPRLMEACYVNGERARPQPGEFYGGWITDNVVGPFKGEPGSEFW